MRRRWSMGAVVALAVAVAVALPGWRGKPERAEAATPTQVTLALQSDGVSLRIVHGEFAVTFTI